MRRRIAVLVAAGLLLGAPAAPAGADRSPPRAVAAKACGAGYKHAVINGAHKCLRRGQFCSPPAASQYRRYGFRCVGGRLK